MRRDLSYLNSWGAFGLLAVLGARSPQNAHGTGFTVFFYLNQINRINTTEIVAHCLHFG
jgi:hypothetical protein